MKTAKQLRAGLVGEGEFIPNAEELQAANDANFASSQQAQTELAHLKAERDELRESVALARVIIERIGYISANDTDNIRRAEAWMKRTEPTHQSTSQSAP